MIRPAGPADLDEVVRLLSAQFLEHDIPTEGLREAMVPVLEGRVDAAALLAVDDRPIGVAYVQFTYTIEHMGRSAWLEELYVEPARRSSGVGTELLRAAIEYARARGAAAMDLEVEAAHERVMGLYEREGFHRHTRTRMVRTWTRTSSTR